MSNTNTDAEFYDSKAIDSIISKIEDKLKITPQIIVEKIQSMTNEQKAQVKTALGI